MNKTSTPLWESVWPRFSEKPEHGKFYEIFEEVGKVPWAINHQELLYLVKRFFTFHEPFRLAMCLKSNSCALKSPLYEHGCYFSDTSIEKMHVFIHAD